MNAMLTVFANDGVYMKHDLMIELMRIEMAMDDALARGAANQPQIATLEKRRQTLNEALVRLTA